MILKSKVEPVGPVVQTKKGGFIRRVLVNDGVGGREVATVYSSDRTKLESLNVNAELSLRTGDFFSLV